MNNKFNRQATKNHRKFSRHFRVKSAPRRVNKSETRYQIMENTMRGYFNYSI